MLEYTFRIYPEGRNLSSPNCRHGRPLRLIVPVLAYFLI
jgi:hypothetical protein